jgi:hypothetical protein
MICSAMNRRTNPSSRVPGLPSAWPGIFEAVERQAPSFNEISPQPAKRSADQIANRQLKIALPLTPIATRARLELMAVASASLASISAVFTSLQNHRCLNAETDRNPAFELTIVSAATCGVAS